MSLSPIAPAKPGLVLLSAILALAAAACASHTQLPTEDRATLERDLSGREAEKFLKLSYYVVPFFGDGTKKLLTPVPPDEVRLLNHPNGTPVNPGKVEKVIPAGTKVRILQVEFPTSWVVTERVPYTPRTQPWIYLSIEGESSKLPFVLVMPMGIKTQEAFRTELANHLADRDLSESMAAFTEPVKEAIRQKTAVTDMPAEALEMAWGRPEIRKVELQGESKTEIWMYPGRKRIAHLTDGRLVRTEVGAQ